MHSSDLHDPLALTVVSSHLTSDGLVSYLRCACGAWEVRTGGAGGAGGAVATIPPRKRQIVD